MISKYVLSVVFLLVSSINATWASDRGFYLGGAIGTSGIDDDGLTDAIPVDVSFKTDDNTYRLIAGYKFNRMVSVEAQYSDYGDMDVRFSAGKGGLTWTPTVVSVAANVGYTFVNGVRPFGIVGLSKIDLDMKYPDGSRPRNDTFDFTGYGIRLGVGVEYIPPPLPQFSLRLGYESDIFDIETSEVDNNLNIKMVERTIVLDSFYLGAMYTF